MSINVNLSVNSNLNKALSPRKKYEVKIAEIDDNNKGIKETKVKSRLNISIAKMIAAIGALKIEDIAAAAAAPINKVRVLLFKWNNLATLDPIAALVATVGPSYPTDPPKPTVIGAVRIELYIL